MRGPSPLYIEERHRALGRDATFSWSRALTHPPRCNRTRHRGRHLVSDFVGAAILDRKSWGRHLGVVGPPSWIWRRDVIYPIVGPILLTPTPMLTPTGSAPTAIYTHPPGWGDIIIQRVWQDLSIKNCILCIKLIMEWFQHILLI